MSGDLNGLVREIDRRVTINETKLQAVDQLATKMDRLSEAITGLRIDVERLGNHIESHGDHETRLKKIENYKARVSGMAAAYGAIAALVVSIAVKVFVK